MLISLYLDVNISILFNISVNIPPHHVHVNIPPLLDVNVNIHPFLQADLTILPLLDVNVSIHPLPDVNVNICPLLAGPVRRVQET